MGLGKNYGQPSTPSVNPHGHNPNARAAGGMPGAQLTMGMSPELAYLMQMGNQIERQGAGLGLQSAMGQTREAGMPPKYAAGGMVGPQGAPIPPPAPQTYSAPGAMQPRGAAALGAGQGNMPPEQLQAEIRRFASQHPEQVAQIKEAIMEALQEGEMTAQQLNTAVQLATVAAQNPQMYPQIRAYIIQQGLMEEEEIPPEYDQGFIFALLIAGQALQSNAPAPGAGVQPPPTGIPGQGNRPIPSMAAGGHIPEKAGGKGVVIEAHEGEYVVPKHVVAMKGKEFFDNLVSKYDPEQQGGKE